MSVAKVTEIIASSDTSFDDAVKEGVKRAEKAIVDKGKITEYRVTMKVSFVLKD